MAEQAVVNSPEQAFRLGYAEGDGLRREGAAPETEAQHLPRFLQVAELTGFLDDWSRGFHAGLRGEPAPTTLT